MRRAMFGGVPVMVVVAAMAGSSGRAQQPEPVVIRSPEAYTVVVDAVVTDNRNRVLSDLEKDDFQLFEDGVQQEIDSVRFVQGEAPSEEAVGAAAAAASGPSSRNLIVFLLDYATTEFTNQKLVREGASRYVSESLRPNDYVAIFSLGAGFRFLRDFTNDREALLAALGGADAPGPSLASAPAAASPAGTASGEVQPITVAGAAPGDFAAAGQAAQAQGSAQADLMLAQRIEQAYYTMVSFVQKREAHSVLGAIQAISQVVGEVPGRKTLVLFSQGFVIGPHMEPELEKTVSMANKANVAIYGVDSQGLATRELSGALVPQGELASISSNTGADRIKATGGESLFDRARQVGSDLRDSTLRYVSTATGGFAIRNSNDLFESLQKVDEDLRAYYLISYRPSNLEFDGQFREIQVEVQRKRAKVRSRAGYIAVPPGMDSLSGEEFRLVRGIASGEVEQDLPVFLRLDRFRGESGPEVLITLELNGSDLGFGPNQQDPGRRTAELSTIGLIRDLEGRVVHRFGAPVSLNATPEEEEALAGVSVRFGNTLAVNPGTYAVEAIVRDAVSGSAGRAEQALRVPEPPAGLAASSIVLGKDVEAAQDQDARLVVEGARLIPSARREFRPSDRLVYYFEVYPPQARPSRPYRVEVNVSKVGASEPLRLPPYEISGPRLASARYLDLSSLTPGRYILEARVVDASDGSETRTRTSFALLP